MKGYGSDEDNVIRIFLFIICKLDMFKINNDKNLRLKNFNYIALPNDTYHIKLSNAFLVG